MTGFATAMLIALAASVGWSLYDLLRRFLTGKLTAWALVFWVTLSALPLAVAWGIAAGDWRVASGYLVPGVASILLNVLANYLYFRSFQLSPLSVTLPMLSLTPVFTALFGALALGEPVTLQAAVGIACVVFGAFRLSTGGGRALAASVEPGSVLMAMVALCWSATLLLDKVALRYTSPPVHTLVLHVGVALGAGLVLVARGRTGELRAIRGRVGLLAAAAGVGIFAVGAQLVAIQSVAIGLVETLKRGVGGVLAVVWGRTFFDEEVTGGKLFAVALLVTGVALILL